MHLKAEEYELFWPEEPEFVRAAARYNARIVPFVAVGAAESIRLILDQKELDNVPFIGDNLRKAFSAELGVPLPPERFYFFCDASIDLFAVGPNDRQQCRHIYGTLWSNVKSSIQSLRKWCRQDSYRQALPRWMFQATHHEEPPIFDMQACG